jgi:hypothetical protein
VSRKLQSGGLAMNKFQLASLVVIISAPAARADGLLYQLPKDGDAAQFELKITNDKENTRTETVVMRSVGRVGDGRWLEFKLPNEDSTQTIKALFPERALREGESPLEHVVRAWSKIGDDMPAALSRVRDLGHRRR